jgi:hypothetical protein
MRVIPAHPTGADTGPGTPSNREVVSVGEGERALVPLPPEATGGTVLVPAEAVRRATGLALGAAGLALEVLRALLERSDPAGSAGREVHAGGAVAAPPGPPGTLRLLPGAALGLGLQAQRRSLDAAATLAARIAPPLRAVTRPAVAVARAPLAAAWRRLDLDGWAARGLAEQRRNRQMAAEAARALLRQLAAAVLAEVDVDAVVARADLDRIVERIDVDAIAARLDIDAVVARVDLPGLTEQVLDEVDIDEIIRQSSGTMAAETVDALREQGMHADHLVNRIVDRVLRRKDERHTDLTGAEPSGGSHEAAAP